MNARNSKSRLLFLVIVILILVGALGATSLDSLVPPHPPQPLPPTGNCFHDNIFYGAVPPNGEDNPVLVFVHGLSGLAQDWWSINLNVGVNDMYKLAYNAGYRTAFVNLNVNLDNPNDCTVERRPASAIMGSGFVLSQQLEAITQYYGVSQVNIVAHSKGGIDAQAAIVWWGAWRYVRNVFTLGSPHQGSLLADLLWSPEGFWVGELLGQRDDATFSIRTASLELFRSVTDSSPVDDAIHYYSGAGTFWRTPNSIYLLTGEWLQNHPEGGLNDGMVTVASTYLPGAKTLFLRPWNHAEVYMGRNAFPYIHQVLLNDSSKFKVYLPLVVHLGAAGNLSLLSPKTRQVEVRADELTNDTPSPFQSDHIVRGGRLTGSTVEFIPIEPQAHAIRFSLLTTDEQVAATLRSPNGLTHQLMMIPNNNRGIFEKAFLLSQVIDQPTPGWWGIQIDGPAGAGYLLTVSFDSQLQVSLDGLPGQPIPPGKAISLTAWGQTPMGAVQIDQLVMRAIRSTSELDRVNFESTTDNRGSSLSHVFGPEDMYGISIQVTGRTLDGLPFERSFVRSVVVVPAEKFHHNAAILSILSTR